MKNDLAFVLALAVAKKIGLGITKAKKQQWRFENVSMKA